LTLPPTIRKVPAWTTLLGIALFAIALWWLHHVIGQYRWRDILAHMRAIRSSQLGIAALLTAAGYGVLTLYDALGLKFAGARLPYPRLALVSFMGYAIGHNVGVNTLSGGAIRFRAYSILGLSAKQIATVVAFGTLTFALGSAAYLGRGFPTRSINAAFMNFDPRIVSLSRQSLARTRKRTRGGGQFLFLRIS